MNKVYYNQSSNIFTNVNGVKNSKEYNIDYNKINNNPANIRLYLRNNNMDNLFHFKENDILQFINKRKKSRKSLSERLKEITQTKKLKKKYKRKRKKSTRKTNKKQTKKVKKVKNKKSKK